MAGRRLPTPITPTDELLAAVHEELVGLRADLKAKGGEAPARARKTAAKGQVEITEPKPSTARKK